MTFKELQVTDVFEMYGDLYQKIRKNKACKLNDFKIFDINDKQEINKLDKNEMKKIYYSCWQNKIKHYN